MLGQPLHPLADAKIAGSHFPQIAVHVVEHHVEKLLGEAGAHLMLALEPVQHQKGVERDHLEAPLDRIGHAQGGEKLRLARLPHHFKVEAMRGVGLGGAAEQIGEGHEKPCSKG